MEIQTVIDLYQQYGIPDDVKLIRAMNKALREANDKAGQIATQTLDLPIQEVITMEMALYYEILVAIGLKMKTMYDEL